jgi:polyhydroxybutyrate depolymerase
MRPPGTRLAWCLLSQVLIVTVACSGESSSSSGNDDTGGAGPSGSGGGVSTPPSGSGGDLHSPPGNGGTVNGTGGVPATGGTPPTNAGGSAGEGGSPSPGGSGGSPPGPCVGDWSAGDYPPGIDEQTYLDITGVPGQQGLTRQYKVHVPPSYDCTRPAPVVFCLHGLSQNPVMFCVQGTGTPAGETLVDKSNAEGFVLVMPLGYQNSWNGAGCCGGASAQSLDDVALLRAIYAQVASHLNLDDGRVYITGFSNGGYMSYRAVCEAADLFVAAAPVAGGLQAGFENTCSPSRPVSILSIHGTADGLVPYSLYAPSMLRIATENGCSATTSSATAPSSGGDTTCISHSGCPEGIEVTGCTVQNGGHVWFGDPDCGTGFPGACAFVGANSNHMVNTDAIWEFFERNWR